MDLGQNAIGFVLLGHVGGDHTDIEPGMNGGQRIAIAGDNYHLGAMRNERLDQSEAEAAASTGNDHFLVFQVHRFCSIA